MTQTDFGPLITAVDVDAKVIDLLQTWLPTYLRQLERERPTVITEGLFDLPKDDNYANVLDDDEFPDHRLPAILVTSAETADPPTKNGDGIYTAGWTVTISSVVRGRTPAETRWIASMFEGSVRRLMVHHPPPFDGEVRWIGSNTAAVADPSGAGRYLAAGMGQYVVYIDKVVQEGVGPIGPGPYDPGDPDDPMTPYDPPVTVGSVSIDVVGKSPAEQGD